MARKRSIKGANVSFFAFQDIITAVSGILILIVILMILMLKAPGMLPTPEPPIPVSTPEEIDKKIAEAVEKIRNFEVVKATGATEADLRAEIAGLEAGLKDDQNPEGKGLEAELKAAKEKRDEAKKKATELQDTRNRIAGEVSEIKGRVKSMADDLAKAEKSSQMWLHQGPSDKSAVIVEVAAQRAVVHSFSDPSIKVELQGVRLLPDFLTRVRQTDKNTAYFVFFIRPDGIDTFYKLRQIVLSEQHTIGYQAIDEKTEINLLGQD